MNKNEPTPPPSRLVTEWGTTFCDVCGSSAIKKYLFFGEKICIRPDCESNTKVDSPPAD